MAHAERLCERLVLMTQGRKVFDGTLAQARAAAPTRLVLEGALDPSTLAALPGLASVAREDGQVDGAGLYTLTLAPGASPQAVLKAALQRDLDISQFKLETPTLHDAFIVLTKTHDGHRERPNDEGLSDEHAKAKRHEG
jgi:ABC-2 type transport system ATP-binding protein